MPDQKTPSPAANLSGALARPDWRAGNILTANDLCLEHRYTVQRMRRHRRLVHGWGVVCGLTVVASGCGWELFVCPGYGITPCGDEIDLVSRHRFDLRDYLWTRPLESSMRRVWVSVEADDEPADLVVGPPASCGCDCGCHDQKPSRLQDAVRVVVSWTRPVFAQPVFDVCSGGAPPCPSCPGSCALPLAEVNLPQLDLAELSNAAVDNFIARTP
jgi:hypothetical protein